MQEWKSPTTTVDLTYSSADTPVFVISSSADISESVSPGMRLRLSQSTGGTKYFIVVAIDTSTLTLYGGTDYELENETIDDPVFSSAKAPVGFPLNPDKWTVSLIDTSDRNQSNPSNGTWYNLGSLSIDVPIGVWKLGYSAELYLNNSPATILDSSLTLSTSNNSESNPSLTSRYVVQDLATHTVFTKQEKNISLSSKTTYYVLARSAQSSADLLALGATTAGVPTQITATSVYL
jgi:hypothetical protein